MFDKSYSGDAAIAASQSAKEREYWLEKLSGEPVKSGFPYDNKEPVSQRGEKGREEISWRGEFFSRLTALGNRSDTRLLTVMAAGLFVLIHKYTGSRDIIIGMPIYKQKIEGDFINTALAIRCLLREDMTFKELLYRVKQTIDDAIKHQNYPIKTLLYDLNLTFSPGDFPLFDILLLLKNIQDPGYMHHIPTNMEFIFFRAPGSLELEVRYDPFLYDQETVERILRHFYHLLNMAIFDVDLSLAGIDILSEEEKKKILEEFNRPREGLDHLDKTIHGLFEEQVEKTPDRTALIFTRQDQEPGLSTYRQLDGKSRRLAGVLKEKGIAAGHIVVLLMESSDHMAVAVLAVLKAGGTYLPVDMEAPGVKKTFILKDSGARLVLTGTAGETALFPGLGEIERLDVSVESLRPHSPGQPGGTGRTGPGFQSKPSDPAYIIYTSGSTGRPKGVIVEHSQAVNTLVCRKEEYRMTPAHTALQLFSYAFDGFITGFFTPVISGARVILLSKQAIADISKIVEVIAVFKVTHFISVPVLFQAILADMTAAEAVSLQVVTLAGDKVPPRLVEMAAAKNKALEIVNEYGTTEVAVMSTIYRHQERDRRVKIGGPIANTAIYITKSGDHRHLVPIGVYGEMCIAGAGVSRGYMNNPDLTAEKFLFKLYRSYRSYKSYIIYKTGDPPAGGAYKNNVLYRTGDLARWLPDGNIEFGGRVDYQVKVRGFRIEPGEIERHLLTHPLIKEAVVTAPGNDEGDKYLCAYIVSTQHAGVSELREYLAARLPEYMIPAYFVFLEKMPLSSNGKVDRKQLPPPSAAGIAGEYAPPRDRLEKQLVEIWAGVLRIEKDTIGIDANFFELGGHSLNATLMSNRINKELNVKVPMVEIFKTPIIRNLAKYIREAEEERYMSIPCAEEKEYYALSASQHRFYLLQQMEPGSAAYNLPLVVELLGEPERKTIEAAFRKLMERHESLRTSFTIVDGKPVAKIYKPSAVEFSIRNYDLEGEEGEEGKTGKAAEEILGTFVRAFDLSQAPLVRVGLIKLVEGKKSRYILMVDMHHILTDIVAYRVLTGDFLTLYNGRELPPLRLRYKDYSEWQNSKEGEELFKRQEAYWRRQFAGEIPVISLPTDFPRPAVQRFEGSTIDFHISKEETAALYEMTRTRGTTLFMTLLAIFNVFLSKICNREDIVVGTPIVGRRHADLENIIGVFLNMLALRNRLNGEKTFIQWQEDLKERTLEAFENQDYPFENLVEQVAVERDISRNPLFDVVFAMENITRGSGEIPGIQMEGLNVRPYAVEIKTSKFDLSLFAFEEEHGLYLSFEYCTGLFREETVKRLVRYFKAIVSSVLENPRKKLLDLEILPEEEKNRLLVEFNDTKAGYPKDKTLHQLVEQQVGQTPDYIALLYEDQQVSYGGMEGGANRLADHLYSKINIQPGERVGILAERSERVIISILGILKAGGAYLPIDPAFPGARLKYIINDAEIGTLISDTRHNRALTGIQGECRALHTFLCIDRTFAEGEKEQEKNKPGAHPRESRPVQPHDLAYVTYTSGTTGIPKGVMIEHRSMVNLMKGIAGVLGFTKEDTVLSLTTISFDIFGTETIYPLTRGAKVVMGNREAQVDNIALNELMKKENISVFQLTPSRLRLVVEDEAARHRLTALKYLLVTGEAFPPILLDKVKPFITGRIFNLYGPTETTVWSTLKEVTADEVNIGRPIANTRIYILDKHKRLLPIRVTGDLYIAGDGLARGYLKNEKLTGERFIDDPFYPGERMYRTGDLARWLTGGDIEFLGRTDHQVKIRGFRIEPGEIETRLSALEGVREAVVIDKSDKNGDKYLCAYIVAEKEMVDSETRDLLARTLPDYMIPSYFIRLEKLPLTPSGKLDRKALPDPVIQAGGHRIAPGDKLEEKLAELWSEVLAVEKSVIGIDANFFRLGGHSLKATILITRIHKEFQVKFPLAEIFKGPNIRAMAGYIKGAVKEKNVSLEVQESKEYYPASSQQKRLYILQQGDMNLIAYNRPNAYITGMETEIEKLEITFRKLIRRHESLRTSFEMIDGEPVQRIHREVPFTIEYEDSDLSRDPMEDFIRPFDLTRAPLLRVRITKTKTGDGKNILMMDIHHIISDGTSDIILARDFMALYQGKQPPPLKFHYKEYSRWQAGLTQSGQMEKQEKYWLETFAGVIPGLAIPRDYEPSAGQGFQGSEIYLELDQKTTAQLDQLAKREQITLFMLLLAVYNVLLAKLSGQEDIVVGTGVAGRRHADFQEIIGMFFNTLALRNYPAKEKIFKDFLREVKERTLQAFDNQDYLFEELVKKVGAKSAPGRNPIFDTAFLLQNLEPGPADPEARNREQPGPMLKPYETGTKTSLFDILVLCEEIGGKLGITVSYRTGIFKKETIEKYFGYYKDILSFIIEKNEFTYRLKDIRQAGGLKTIKSTLVRKETGDFGF